MVVSTLLESGQVGQAFQEVAFCSDCAQFLLSVVDHWLRNKIRNRQMDIQCSSKPFLCLSCYILLNNQWFRKVFQSDISTSTCISSFNNRIKISGIIWAFPPEECSQSMINRWLKFGESSKRMWCSLPVVVQLFSWWLFHLLVRYLSG